MKQGETNCLIQKVKEKRIIKNLDRRCKESWLLWKDVRIVKLNREPKMGKEVRYYIELKQIKKFRSYRGWKKEKMKEQREGWHYTEWKKGKKSNVEEDVRNIYSVLNKQSTVEASWVKTEILLPHSSVWQQIGRVFLLFYWTQPYLLQTIQHTDCTLLYSVCEL